MIAARITDTRGQECRGTAEVVRRAGGVASKEAVPAGVVAAGLVSRAGGDDVATAGAGGAGVLAGRILGRACIAAAWVPGRARRQEGRAAAWICVWAAAMAAFRAGCAWVVAACIVDRALRSGWRATAGIVRGALGMAGGIVRGTVVRAAGVVCGAVRRREQLHWLRGVQGGEGTRGPGPGGLVVSWPHDPLEQAVIHLRDLPVKNSQSGDAAVEEVRLWAVMQRRAADGEGVGRGVAEGRLGAVGGVLRELVIRCGFFPTDVEFQRRPVSCTVRQHA